MITINVYNKYGQKVCVFDGTDVPTFVGEILNFEYNDEDTDFKVVWCSIPENGSQIAVVEMI